MYTYLLPVDDHFPAQVTYRGCGILALLKNKFGDLGLLSRVENSPFRHFFNGSDRPLQFSGAIIHELLLRKIVTDNKDEIHFGLGQKACRFGRLEYTLITGLSMRRGPSLKAVDSHSRSSRLRDVYLNGSDSVSLGNLIGVFQRFADEDPEKLDDALKIGLVILLEGYFFGNAPTKVVTPKYLRLVDDLGFFYTMPWGQLTWEATFAGLSVDMQKLRAISENSASSSYTVLGCAHSLQYWAYEAIGDIALNFAVTTGPQFPRMHSWTSVRAPNTAEVKRLLSREKCTALALLKPRPNEVDFHRETTKAAKRPRYTGLENIHAEVEDEERAEVNLEFEARGISNAPAKTMGTVALYPAIAGMFGNGNIPASDHPPLSLATTAQPPFDARLCSVEGRLKKVEEKQDLILEKLDHIGKVLVLLSKERQHHEILVPMSSDPQSTPQKEGSKKRKKTKVGSLRRDFFPED